MIIAIDGPAASGKGTLGRRLAEHFGFAHLDTGLLYRAVARVLLDGGLALADQDAAARAAQNLDVTHLDDPRLLGAEMGEAASVISAYQPVRDALLAFQRGFAGQPPGAVLDGRDIGTVVFPDAPVKLFVTASVEARARRRFEELRGKGLPADPAQVEAELRRRDMQDAERRAAPLRAAPDALLLDTTTLDIEAAFDAALALVRERLAAAGEAQRG
jgi:cytidylate kinase